MDSLKIILEDKLDIKLTDAQMLNLIDRLIIDESKNERMVYESRPNIWESVWGKLLRNPELEVEGSSSNKKFLLRFRIPYILFRDYIVPTAEQDNIFEKKRNSYVLLICFYHILFYK